MPIDDLTALGQKMREARKKKDLTQQDLADLSHVSVKQIASIEKGQINPSYLILKALAKVLPLSLDTLINPDVSPEDEGANQMKMLYCSCPSEMRETLLHHTQDTDQTHPYRPGIKRHTCLRDPDLRRYLCIPDLPFSPPAALYRVFFVKHALAL